jgi:hypothetical protein
LGQVVPFFLFCGLGPGMAEPLSSPVDPFLPPSFIAEQQSSLKEDEKHILSKKFKKNSRRSPTYTPKVELVVSKGQQKLSMEQCKIVNSNLFLLIRYKKYHEENGKTNSCIFIKKFFEPEEINSLNEMMRNTAYWESREDCRGNRLTSITGHWNARGRFRPG